MSGLRPLLLHHQPALTSPISIYWNRLRPDVLSILYDLIVTLFSSCQPLSEGFFFLVCVFNAKSSILAVKFAFKCFQLVVRRCSTLFQVPMWCPFPLLKCDFVQTALQSNCAKQTRLPCPRYEKQTSGLVNLPSGEVCCVDSRVTDCPCDIMTSSHRWLTLFSGALC